MFLLDLKENILVRGVGILISFDEQTWSVVFLLYRFYFQIFIFSANFDVTRPQDSA